MLRRRLSAFALALSLFAPLGHAGEPNTLTEAEKKDGWVLLFDGKTSNGWVNVGKTTFPEKGWVVEDGALKRTDKGGDIVTTKDYLNFELTWEWNLAEAGNSGLKYNLADPKKNVGFEYQMLDDTKHPDAKVRGRSRQSASLYDLIEPAADKKLNPPGQWNQSRVLVNGNHVEHWLNGAKTVEFEIGSEAMKTAIAGSKYAKIANFGVKAATPILIQDHGDLISIRSMKIRELPAK